MFAAAWSMGRLSRNRVENFVGFISKHLKGADRLRYLRALSVIAMILSEYPVISPSSVVHGRKSDTMLLDCRVGIAIDIR